MGGREDQPRRSSADRPLDVLIVSQSVDYGVAIYVRQLTQAAVAAGHAVTVVSPGSARGPLQAWVEAAGARHRSLDMARSPSIRDPFDVLTLRGLARGRDVVHLHSSKASALGRVAARSIGRRDRPVVVMTPHYWSWLVGGRWSSLYRWIERALAGRCDAIVAVSEREATEGRTVLGADAPVLLLPNGVDRTRFSPDGPRAERVDGSRLIVCVGRLSEQKGQDVAIRALALVADRTARLRFVGGESSHGERIRLERIATSLGVMDRIEWRGPVDDTAPEYRAADIVIAPSRWEGDVAGAPRGDVVRGGHRGDRRLRRRGGGRRRRDRAARGSDGAGSGDRLAPSRSREETGTRARGKGAQRLLRPREHDAREPPAVVRPRATGHPSGSIARPAPLDGANPLDRGPHGR